MKAARVFGIMFNRATKLDPNKEFTDVQNHVFFFDY
jgi:hypothetical protein